MATRTADFAAIAEKAMYCPALEEYATEQEILAYAAQLETRIAIADRMFFSAGFNIGRMLSDPEDAGECAGDAAGQAVYEIEEIDDEYVYDTVLNLLRHSRCDLVQGYGYGSDGWSGDHDRKPYTDALAWIESLPREDWEGALEAFAGGLYLGMARLAREAMPHAMETALSHHE